MSPGAKLPLLCGLPTELDNCGFFCLHIAADTWKKRVFEDYLLNYFKCFLLWMCVHVYTNVCGDGGVLTCVQV